jgi:hypothetical protein
MKKQKLSAAIRQELGTALDRVQQHLEGANATIMGAVGESIKNGDPVQFTCTIENGEVTLACGPVKHKFKDR